MNPFDRLRRAVDRVELNYAIAEQKNEGEEYQEQELAATKPVLDSKRKQSQRSQQSLGSTQQQQQQEQQFKQKIQCIQEINTLTHKVEKLSRAVKAAEVEKEQLITQICTVEKNNEKLEAKLNECSRCISSFEQKQRRYKEEIHRINATVDLLGGELNAQRSAKRAAVQELSRLKEQVKVDEDKSTSNAKALKQQIDRLQEQIAQRASMLQYNMKKNSEERNEAKVKYERQKSTYISKIEAITAENNKIKQNYYALQSENAVLKNRVSAYEDKLSECQAGREKETRRAQELGKKADTLAHGNRQLSQKFSEMLRVNEMLRDELEAERNNIKIKVVEIKDEMVELELEMYRSQCKELLQERALLERGVGRIKGVSKEDERKQRIFEPAYRVIEHEADIRDDGSDIE